MLLMTPRHRRAARVVVVVAVSGDGASMTSLANLIVSVGWSSLLSAELRIGKKFVSSSSVRERTGEAHYTARSEGAMLLRMTTIL